MCCPFVGCKSASDQGSVYPLTFGTASTGGVITQTVTGQGVSGLATIVVIPEEGEAVSFNADTWTALTPLTRWVMRWGNFPRSYALLR